MPHRFRGGRASFFVRHWLTSLVVTLGLAGVSPAAEPTWLKLKCDDFSLYTDASQRDMENFALTYSAFRQISRDLLLRPGASVPPSTIILFRRTDSLKKYAGAPDDPDFRIAAFSIEVDGRLLTAVSVAGDREQAQSTVFEFETIWMFDRLGYLLPTWISQGAGEVISSLAINKSNAVLGRDPERFNDDDTIPWKRFFEINQASPEYKGKNSTGAFHAQAWSLMHWVLLDQDDARERFQRVSAELNILHFDEITRVLDCPVADLDRALNRHFKGRLKTKTFPFDPVALRAKWTIAPASTYEVMAHKADLLASHQPAEAHAELDRALALAPDAPIVHEALARLAFREGDAESAIRYYRSAIEHGSKNAIPRLRSASAHLDESSGGTGSDRAGNAGSNAAEAIAEIRDALAIEPRNLEAYRLLGRALFVSPKLAENDIEELTPGIVPGRDGAYVRFYRALLYSRLNLSEQAAADFKAIAADPAVPSQDRKRAEDCLARETAPVRKR